MIYDVLNLLDTALKDGTYGINARLRAADLAKGTNTPEVNEFLTWDQSKTPADYTPPTLLVVWEGSRDLELQQQGKWNSSHLISLQWFHDEQAAEQARRDAAITAQALLSFLDYISEEDPILEIRDVTLQVVGWPLAGRRFTWVALAGRYKERDEFPTGI